MSQSRLHSFIEAWANVAVGFGVNFIANLCIFPLFGMHISLSDNFLMGLIYTAISVSGFLLSVETRSCAPPLFVASRQLTLHISV